MNYKDRVFPEHGGITRPDIQRNQPQVDVDRCQHESDRFYTVKDRECRKCGEFYR